MNVCSVFPSLAVHQQVICSYIMYKCSPIKKNISTQNHSDVNEVQFELISTLKLTARARLPRRHSATPSHQTENGTVNRHTHSRMQRAFPSLLPIMSQSTISAGNTTGITENSLGHHLGYCWQCKKCLQKNVSVQMCTFRPWNTEWNRHQRATESH